MEKTKSFTIPRATDPVALALTVLAACFCLFYSDKDTRQFSDLYTWSILFVGGIYFIPPFLITWFLFKLFSPKQGRLPGGIISLLIGIPLGFALVMAFLYSLQ